MYLLMAISSNSGNDFIHIIQILPADRSDKI